jgi:DNA-binding XRE family transcriptional regulator
MNTAQRNKLEAAGFKFGDAADFLDLSPHEAALVETRLALADALRSARESAGMSQARLATAIGSSQSRIAKAEAADPSISTDLMLRALFGTGARPAHVLSRKVARHEGVTIEEPRRT